MNVFHYRTICYENHDKQVVAGHWTFQYYIKIRADTSRL